MTTRTRIPTSTTTTDERTRIRVAIADDHDLMRTGLRVILSGRDDIDIIWEATSHQEARSLMDVAMPDLLLADPELHAAACASPPQAGAAKTAVILLAKSSAAHPSSAVGGPLHLDPRAGRRELDRLIRVAVSADDPVVHNVDVSGERTADPDDVEILALVADGRTNRQIARQLGIGEEIVKVRLRSVFARLRVASRSAAVVKAIRLGIIE